MYLLLSQWEPSDCCCCFGFFLLVISWCDVLEIFERLLHPIFFTCFLISEIKRYVPGNIMLSLSIEVNNTTEPQTRDRLTGILAYERCLFFIIDTTVPVKCTSKFCLSAG